MEGKTERITTATTTKTTKTTVTKRKRLEKDDDDDDDDDESSVAPKSITPKRKYNPPRHGGIFEYGTESRQSHTTFTVKCTATESPKCKGEVITRYNLIMNSFDNHGKYVCVCCTRTPAVMARKRELAQSSTTVETFVLGAHDRNSIHRVRACCELKASSKCLQHRIDEYREIVRTCERNEGKYVCQQCYNITKKMGRNNPNCKYALDDNFLRDIDTEFKAYLLGWIGSDGGFAPNGSIIITLHEMDVLILEKLRDGICPQLAVTHPKERPHRTLHICSTTMSADACRWLGLSFKKGESYKKWPFVQFPQLKSDELKWAFLRGYFDGDGCIHVTKSGAPRASISSNSKLMLTAIRDFVDLPGGIYKIDLHWAGVSTLVFMNKLYHNATIYLDRKYDKFQTVKHWRPNPSSLTDKLKIGLAKLAKLLDDDAPNDTSTTTTSI